MKGYSFLQSKLSVSCEEMLVLYDTLEELVETSISHTKESMLNYSYPILPQLTSHCLPLSPFTYHLHSFFLLPSPLKLPILTITHASLLPPSPWQPLLSLTKVCYFTKAARKALGKNRTSRILQAPVVICESTRHLLSGS